MGLLAYRCQMGICVRERTDTAAGAAHSSAGNGYAGAAMGEEKKRGPDNRPPNARTHQGGDRCAGRRHGQAASRVGAVFDSAACKCFSVTYPGFGIRPRTNCEIQE